MNTGKAVIDFNLILMIVMVPVGLLCVAQDDPNAQYQEAVTKYKHLCNLKWHHNNLSKYGEVIAIAGRIVANSSNADLALKSQGLIIDCYERQAEYARQDIAFEKYIEMCENGYGAHKAEEAIVSSADSYFNRGTYYEARRYYGKLIRRYPKSPKIGYCYYKIAESYAGMERLTQAIPEYKKALETCPEVDSWTGEAYFKLTGALSREHRYQEAISVLAALDQKFPQSRITADVRFYKGYFSYEQGDITAAKEEFHHVVEDYPNSTAANQAKRFLDVLNKEAGKHGIH
jgi:TolA-binding protein